MAGETAVVENDVSLWHGAILDSTLMQDGDRAPKIRRGAVLGSDAIVPGAVSAIPLGTAFERDGMMIAASG